MKRNWWQWLLVFLGVTIVLIYLSKLPAKGKISYQSDKSPIQSPMEYIRYDGNDINFSYENKYELRDNGTSLELVGNANVPSHIVISVNKVNTGDIEEVPGVLMRRLKNEEYNEEKINWGETEGVLFNNSNNFELSAFFIKDGRAVTVAMTANSNNETKLREEFGKLVNSMEIKNSIGN
jgi:hypothetical protein